MVDQPKTAAQTPNETASTTSALAGPSHATRPPASAAPAKLAVRSMAADSPVDPLERHGGVGRQGWDERVLGAVARPAQGAADGHQDQQQREVQGAGQVEQRHQPDHDHAEHVAGDRDPACAEPVDERPGQLP